MQIKTYFASSVPAAFDVARQELGAEALFVRSGPAPIDFRHLGRFEVTFGLETGETQPDDEQAAREYSRVAEQLIESGFSRHIAEEIATAASRRQGDPADAVVAEITGRIPVTPVTQMAPRERRAMAFIGPPGRGKTTSLVKIAVKLGLSRRVPVRIFSVGAQRVGAQEQIARLAATLGIPWQPRELLANSDIASASDGWQGLTLIDTPGISPADRAEYSGLSEFFEARPQVEKHLVLRAEGTSADMLGMISRFGRMRPTRLLFTGLDEASSVASFLDAVIRSGIPAAFTGTGQQIPGDLEEVDPERLARSVLAGTAAVFREAQHARTAA